MWIREEKSSLSCPTQAEAIQNILGIVDCAISCGACFPKTALREMSGGKQKRVGSVTTLRSRTTFRWSPKCLSKLPWNIYFDFCCGYFL